MCVIFVYRMYLNKAEIKKKKKKQTEARDASHSV